MILLNGEIIKITKFPNNEVLIKAIDEYIIAGINNIDLKFESNEDFIRRILEKGSENYESKI
jgi:hypothetical protein